MTVFYVYVDRTDDHRPFYVGKGDLARIKRKERGAHWKSIAAKHGFYREVFVATKDECFSFQEEIRLIAALKTFEGDGDPLAWGANKTRGGEGSSGYKWTNESRANASGTNHRMHGKHQSDELVIRRAHVGENHRDARLTLSQVESIRRRYKQGDESYATLGREFGVTRAHIGAIIRNKKWKTKFGSHLSKSVT